MSHVQVETSFKQTTNLLMFIKSIDTTFRTNSVTHQVLFAFSSARMQIGLLTRIDDSGKRIKAIRIHLLSVRI